MTWTGESDTVSFKAAVYAIEYFEFTLSPVAVTGVTLSPNTAQTIDVDGKVTFTASVQPDNAANTDVVWSVTEGSDYVKLFADSACSQALGTGALSSDTPVYVKGVAVGMATVTATSSESEDVKAACEVTVKAAVVPVDSVTLNKESAGIAVGNTVTLSVDIEPSDATNTDVVWSVTEGSDYVKLFADSACSQALGTDALSSDTPVYVKGVAAGTATITVASSESEDVKAVCEVTVKAAVVPVDSVTLNKTSADIAVGGTLTLTATVSPEDATDKTVTWKSSDEKIATVENGTVKGVAAGTATITATAGEKSATCTVTVKADSKDTNDTATIGDGSAADATSIEGYLKDNPEKLTTVTKVEIENASSLETLSGIEKLTNLETLTIDNASKLTDISEVKDLTQLKTLEVSNCSALETATLSSKSLKEVTMSDCDSLTELDVSQCPQLQSLDVSDGSLEKLNVTGCSNLKALDCSNNHLGSLDAADMSAGSSLVCANQQKAGWTAGLSMDLTAYAGPAGAKLASGTVRVASVGKVLDVKAADSNQQEIAVEYTPGDSVAKFAKTPAYVVYLYDTDFNNISMDVMITASGVAPVTGPTSSKGSGGCDAGLGLAGMMAVVSLFMRKRS